MKSSTKRVVWTVSMLALANWFAAGADMTGSPRSTDADSSLQTPAQQRANDNDTSAATVPQEYNKASGIIGMDVQNQQGEHLGHIKDVVFDLKTERISYAVMTTASKAMPINEKLIAVPLNAFTVSTDQKHLVLNADKTRVDAAMGFTSKNWPNVGSPAWGAEPFWQQNNNSGSTTKQNDK